MNLQGIESDELSEPRAEQIRQGSGKRGRARGLVLAMVALAVAAAVWAYLANAGTGRSGMDMSQPVAFGNTPFPVVVEPAVRGPVTGTVVYTGSVAAFSEEDIYARVTGRIVDMPVYPGDAVRAGQVIARLDSVELSSRVAEAEASLAAAEASRAQMSAEALAAGGNILQMEKELVAVEAELTYARAVLSRSERLVQIGAIARQDYDRDLSMAASTEARRAAARARLDQARAMEVAAGKKTEVADSQVAQGRAVTRTARVVRDYAEILAPSSGYVVKRLVAPGVLVQPGMAILKLTRIDRVRLQANVGERDLASIQVGAAVTASTADGGASLAARVTAVFPFVDPGARTALVEALVDNAGRRFLPGQYVTMRFVTGDRPDAVTVPRGAVARLGGKATVWVLSGDRAEPQPVVTGLEGPDRIEITEGLRGGERVVARGHEVLYAGARVAETSGSGSSATAPERGRETPRGEGGHGSH